MQDVSFVLGGAIGGAALVLLLIALAFATYKLSDRFKVEALYLYYRVKFRKEEIRCPRCGGNGYIVAGGVDGGKGFPCSGCDGTGQTELWRSRNKNMTPMKLDEERRKIRELQLRRER